LNRVALVQALNNVSKACRKLGISRQHYHDIRKAIEEEGLEGLFVRRLT